MPTYGSRGSREGAAIGARDRDDGPPSAPLPAAVRECLDRVRARWRALRLLEGAGAAAGVASIAILALFGADNALHLAPPVRLALLLGAIVAILWVAVRRLVLEPSRRLGDEECALLVERGHANLEDRLINTVSFARRRHDGIERAAVELVSEEAAARLGDLPWRGILDPRRAARLLSAAGAAAFLLALYAAVFPAHFRNAASRFARPLADIAPITRTRLAVAPGDVEIVAGGAVEVRAETSGALPEKALLRLSPGGPILMAFDGRSFAHRIEGIRLETRYRVEAGDARSPWHRIRVLEPPEVKSIDLTVRPPAYTGLPPREEKGSSGSVEAIEGSEVRLSVLSTRPAATARLIEEGGLERELAREADDRFAIALALHRDISYRLVLADAEGVSAPGRGARRTLAAVPDAPPGCAIVEPSGDAAVRCGPGRGIPVSVRATDDVGLAAVRIIDRESRVLARSEAVRGEREAVVAASIDPAAFGDPPPGTVVLRAVAVDLKGTETTSPPRKVRLLPEDAAAARAERLLERFRADLAQVLRREEAIERATARMDAASSKSAGTAGGAGGEGASPEETLRRLALEQYDLRDLLVAILGRFDGEGRGIIEVDAARETLRELSRAATSLMPDAALFLLSAVTERAHVARALEKERETIDVLRRALGSVERLAREARSEGAAGAREAALSGASRGARGQLRDLLERIQEFSREQKDVIARTAALEGKAPEDFTAEETASLEDLVAIEERWGRLLEEKGTDLSKVMPQDMSLGTLAEEVLELVEEIDLAKGYLEGRNIELAVPVEQSGVALSERIETNIEKWLLRDRDRLKWVMEDPTGEFDVPLADLPSELEDLIGELIDREELMGAETEDVTSSWLDSLDDGIGWDAMDGPISNMSAKGVTGNLQPNDMEIGGRSGEGRSGKSHGQFVEETAGGKGGRQTPTRSTADAFEPGEVEDAGQDPTGGATGGGKLAGAGPEGLRGHPSPELDRRVGRLAERQVGVLEDGEKVDLALRRRRYFSQDLGRALDLMRSLEEALRRRAPADYDGIRKAIVSELRDARRAVARDIDRAILERASVPERAEHDLLDARGEEAPREYDRLIREYYASLGRSAAAPRAGGEAGEGAGPEAAESAEGAEAAEGAGEEAER